MWTHEAASNPHEKLQFLQRAGYFTRIETQQPIMREASYTHMFEKWIEKQKPIFPVSHCEASLRQPHTDASKRHSVIKETRTQVFTFTSHTVIHKVIWASYWGVGWCSRPAIHTAMGSAAGQRPGATQGKAIEQKSNQRKLSDAAAAPDLSYQLITRDSITCNCRISCTMSEWYYIREQTHTDVVTQDKYIDVM